jgi:hypothetical protein
MRLADRFLFSFQHYLFLGIVHTHISRLGLLVHTMLASLGDERARRTAFSGRERQRQRKLVYTTYYAGSFSGSEARPTKVDLVSSLRPSRTYVRFLSLGFFLNLVLMAFPLILACAVFRFWRREAFTALGLSCVRAVCWESLPGSSSYAVEFLVWWVLARRPARPRGMDATVVVLRDKRSCTPPRGRQSRPSMHTSVLSAPRRGKCFA